MDARHCTGSQTPSRLHGARCPSAPVRPLRRSPPHAPRRTARERGPGPLTTASTGGDGSSNGGTNGGVGGGSNTKQQVGVPQARRPESLRDPAHIGAQCSKQVKVKEVPGYTLDEYMRLPVEQYYELDPQMIRPLGASRFLLTVPRIQLFNVWLEPVVQVQVVHDAMGDKVVIRAISCSLNGSELVQSMGLDRRFVLNFTTELTWDSPACRQPPPGSSEPSSSSAAAALSPSAKHPPQTGTIFASLQLDVFTEVVPPFNLMPRGVLEGTANTVLGGFTAALLPVFVRKLGSDYERWASDPTYRKRRRAQASAAEAGDNAPQQQQHQQRPAAAASSAGSTKRG